jgi:ferrochelatase
MMQQATIIVNFGGPRDLNEVYPFLKELLTDRDVIRTRLPKILNTLLFTRVAKKRAKKVCLDYEEIGGKSPIFDDTEALAHLLKDKFEGPVLTFHRYLTATHQDFLTQVENLKVDRIRLFPLFPQFTYATTGSAARFFEKHLSKKTVAKFRWVKSYPTHVKSKVFRILGRRVLITSRSVKSSFKNGYTSFRSLGPPKFTIMVACCIILWILKRVNTYDYTHKRI